MQVLSTSDAELKLPSFEGQTRGTHDELLMRILIKASVELAVSLSPVIRINEVFWLCVFRPVGCYLSSHWEHINWSTVAGGDCDG